jgi:hypothetical protein
MDDMTAFERQLSDQIGALMGPPRPVDDLAVFDAVVAANRQQRWGFTMFSVLRFVAAAVILALFGGFLVAGVLTTSERDGFLPAAATEPPAPPTTEEMLAGMAIEVVEPGVRRIANDGIRDLGAAGGTWGQHGGVTIGADGTVWIHEASGRYYRVGGETTRDLPQAFRHVGDSPRDTFGADALHAGPAGGLWARDAQLGRVNVWSDTGWLERSGAAIDSMAVDGANEAWAAGSFGLLQIDADDATIVAWPDDAADEVITHSLDVSAEGTVYVLAGPGEILPDGGFVDTLMRYDGKRWTTVTLPTPISAFLPGDGMGVGADGTVWVAADDHGADDYMHHSLARLDGTEWTVFDAADGVRPWGGKEGFVPDEMLGVATDGSVWVDAAVSDSRGWAACDGVARFDGSTWSQYLPGRCLADIDFAPDGSAWVLAAESAEYAEVLPYVITPESTTAQEPSVPTTTGEALWAMTTREVEPGVRQVVNDGVRDVEFPAVRGYGGLSSDPDGGIWVTKQTTAYRLGEPDTLEWVPPNEVAWGSVQSLRAMTADGTLWAAGGAASRDGPVVIISSFDGESWTDRATLDGSAQLAGITTTPDGVAWATTTDSSQCPDDFSGPSCRRTLLVRIGETGASTSPGWEAAEAGRLSWHTPVVSPSGDLWLIDDGDAEMERCAVGAFRRYDGTDWHVVDVPDGLNIAQAGESFGFGPDGTLWAAIDDGDPQATCWDANRGLARLDESGWSVFTEHDGVRPWGSTDPWGGSDLLRVAPDGSVWVNGVSSGDACDGVASFDGASWTPYLQGYCVADLEITSEGNVWVLASSGPYQHLYVISPEAAAAVDEA